MPTGSEGSHVFDGLTARSSIQVGTGGSSGGRVYITAPPSIYVMSVDDTTYSARATLPGLRDIHSTSASDCLQQCVDSLGVLGGTITLLRGTYAWTAPVLLPKNVLWPLRIVGESKAAVVQLSAAGQRVFDFNKTADHDIFQNFEFGNFSIDASALVGTPTGGFAGRNHVLCGTYVNGIFLLRYQFKKIKIHDIYCFGAPTDYTGVSPSQHRLFIYLHANHATVGEGTQDLVQDITCERLRVEGGNQAIAIGSHVITGESTGLTTNVLCERITLRDCYTNPTESTGSSAPTGFGTWDNYQIGAAAMTRDVLVENCQGFNAGDLGLEVNNASGFVVRGNHFHNAWTGGYFLQQFNTPGYGTGGGQLQVEANTYEQSTLASVGNGLSLVGTQGIDAGVVAIRDFGYFSSVPVPGSSQAIHMSNTFCKRVIIDGVHAEFTGLATTGSPSIGAVGAQSITTGPEIVISNVECVASGSVVSGTLAVTGVILTGNGGSALRADISGVAMRENVTGMTAGGTKGVVLGDSTLNTTFSSPVVRRVQWVTSADTAPVGVVVNGTLHTTISNGRIYDCDFSALPAGGTEIQFAGTSNAANIGVYGVNWKTAPTSGAWPSLAATTVANTNKFGYPVMVAITAGTVTLVTTATPGASAQTIATATSATLPVSFYLAPGSQFTITYTVAPTVVYIPVLT